MFSDEDLNKFMEDCLKELGSQVESVDALEQTRQFFIPFFKGKVFYYECMLSDDLKVLSTGAKYFKKYYDSLIEVGFTPDQAIQLVCRAKI